jgi:hypothetical protein
MATTKATLTITSSDLLSDPLSMLTSSTLTTAGTDTGLTQTAGLARTNFFYEPPSPIHSKIIYRSDDATTNGANKVYLKNLSTTATEFFTVFIDQEEMGRLYAGDWAFFPWSATAGTKETFVTTIGGTWVAGETWEFDGVLVTAADTVAANIAAQINAENFPNWTTTIDGTAITFTARHSIDSGTVPTATADIEDQIVQTGGSDATSAVSAAAVGVATSSDIFVVPSVATSMDLEHALFKE